MLFSQQLCLLPRLILFMDYLGVFIHRHVLGHSKSKSWRDCRKIIENISVLILHIFVHLIKYIKALGSKEVPTCSTVFRIVEITITKAIP